MSTLTVWKFNSVDGADKALTKLGDLQKQQLIQVLDAAVVSWPTGRKRPKTVRRSIRLAQEPWEEPSGACCLACCFSHPCWA